MKRVTGGGVPAEIWRNFMVAALPRLKAQPIPVGATLGSDPIGDVIDEDGATPPAPQVDPPPSE